nr:elongator complex protein 4 [Quercus suber]
MGKPLAPSVLKYSSPEKQEPRATHAVQTPRPLFCNTIRTKQVTIMAFRKRTAVLDPGKEVVGDSAPRNLPGVRPSPLTSHSITSTGTASLDGLLGGYGGLVLGSSILVEESGTTDFAGALLRFYAAEGICQGHVIHIVGLGKEWTRELPGIAEEKSSRKTALKTTDSDEKMRIAWRYERLGRAGERGAWRICSRIVVSYTRVDLMLLRFHSHSSFYGTITALTVSYSSPRP